MGTKIIPREVGKINNLRELREFRYNLKLSEIQKNLIIGTLFGDGCLIPNSWGKLYRLQIEHGIDQKEYVLWKYRILKDFVLTGPKFQEKNQSWKFRTGSHPEFTELANEFYDARRHKKIPQNSVKFLKSPFTTAVWYMDDGGLRCEKGKAYGAFFNTQSFSRADNKELQKILGTNYGIEAMLMLNHGKPRIYIPKRSLHILKNVIEPHIHESLRYKLP